MCRSPRLIAQISFQSIIFSIIFVTIVENVTAATANKSDKAVFHFPEYDYKESGKNVREFSSSFDFDAISIHLLNIS